jgi:hypothetical protein
MCLCLGLCLCFSLCCCQPSEEGFLSRYVWKPASSVFYLPAKVLPLLLLLLLLR